MKTKFLLYGLALVLLTNCAGSSSAPTTQENEPELSFAADSDETAALKKLLINSGSVSVPILRGGLTPNSGDTGRADFSK